MIEKSQTLLPWQRVSQVSEEKNKALLELSQKFESILSSHMIEAMRSTIPDSGFLTRSSAEKMYQSMLDSSYAGTLGETNALGLSKMIYQHLIELENSKKSL